MAVNNAINDDMVVRYGTAYLKNEMKICEFANRKYEKDFTNKTGDTLRIQEPNYYQARDGVNFVPKSINQNSKALVVMDEFGQDFEIDSRQLAQSFPDLANAVVKPAIESIKVEANKRMMAQINKAFHFTGSSGAPLNSFPSVNAGRTVLKKFGIESNNAYGIYSIDDYASIAGGLNNNFNTRLNSFISKTGDLPYFAGHTILEDNDVLNHVSGTASAATVTVDGATQSGLTLNVTGLAVSDPDAFKEGDLLVIDGILATNVNNQTGVSAAQFSVAADVGSDGSGNAAVTLNNPITPTVLDPNEGTVTDYPANGATVTVIPSHQKNFIAHPDACTMVSQKLPEAPGRVCRYIEGSDGRGYMSIRYVRDWNYNTGAHIFRFDVLMGFLVFNKYLALNISQPASV